MSADLDDTETTEALLARVARQQDALSSVLRVARSYAETRDDAFALRAALDSYDRVINGS